MSSKDFIAFALAQYEEQSRAAQPDISEKALIRDCLDRLKQDITQVGGAFEQSFDEIDNYINENEKFNDHQRKIKNIDVKYWRILKTWSPRESAFLALEMDPDKAKLSDIKESGNYERYKKIKRASERYIVYKRSATAVEICSHLNDFDASFPHELIVGLGVSSEVDKYRKNIEFHESV